MFRLLIILVLVNFGELHLSWDRHDTQKPWRHRIHHEYHRRHKNTVLDDLAGDIIKIDMSIKQLCTRNGNENSREVFGIVHYNVIVPLIGYSEADISVKTKYRLLHVNAQKPGDNYDEIRILPELVDPSSAYWTLVNGELSIIFPYISPLNNDAKKTCEVIIDNTILTIPKSDETEGGIDIRVADDEGEDGQTVKRVLHNNNITSNAQNMQGDAKPVEEIKEVSNDLSEGTIKQSSNISIAGLEATQ